MEVEHMQINYSDITRAAIKLGFPRQPSWIPEVVFKPEYRYSVKTSVKLQPESGLSQAGQWKK